MATEPLSDSDRFRLLVEVFEAMGVEVVVERVNIPGGMSGLRPAYRVSTNPDLEGWFAIVPGETKEAAMPRIMAFLHSQLQILRESRRADRTDEERDQRNRRRLPSDEEQAYLDELNDAGSDDPQV